MKKGLGYTLIFVALVFASCLDKPVYPTEPVIAYKDFIRYGDPKNPDSVEVVVSFTDNEGDVGLEQSDTFGIFKNGNIFLDYLFWDTIGADHWSYFDQSPATPVPFDTFRVSYRVPPVLPEGDPAEPIKGLIYAKIKPFQPFIDSYKRFKLVVYLYDKSLHRSDTIHTPPFQF